MKLEAPRGTADVLPGAQAARERIITIGTAHARRARYGLLTSPTFEATELFARTAGEASDVVVKEMYTFEDRAGRSLTLRPEGTAQVARVYIEHGLHREPQPVKLFYVGPMFRYAAPQRGRLREFWQVGFEALGSDDPAVDGELIALFASMATDLGLETLRLDLNSIGCRKCRSAYLVELSAFLESHEGELDEATRRRAAASPLRVFDTNDPAVALVLSEAPEIGAFLCEACRSHFEAVRRLLDAQGIEFDVQPRLVRGLDYYTRTVFEFVDQGLDAAQSTVCAGGRYDYLVEQLGGPETPGVGWAAGVERLALSLEAAGEGDRRPPRSDLFFAFDGLEARDDVLVLMASLRERWTCDTDYAGRSFKGQLTQAKRAGARLVVVARAGGFELRERGQPDTQAATLDELRALLEQRLG
ncbi:MAG: histidine--tRNA ligase [Gaiellales bacterium]